MSNIKYIKNDQDYKEALKLVEDLMMLDPDSESTEGVQLNLLATLIQDYESRKFSKDLPDPIEAIKFRMEQANLKPVDLIPFIGSRSRVSEILSGKRQLTLEMVRALESGLGIPAKVLIQKPNQSVDSQFQSWDQRLLKEMTGRGYFGSLSLKGADKIQILKDFFQSAGTGLQPAFLLRKTNYRSAPLTDKNALAAWMVRVVNKAKAVVVPVKYTHGIVDLAFMRNLIKLSTKENGPLLAREYLKNAGIKLIIEQHLPKTHLDGAAILDAENPIIGLTLRHDRLDNFWFTLMHELSHVALHYGNDVELFYDEKLQDKNGTNINNFEEEADNLAEESILPKSIWEVSPAKITPSPMAAQSLANEIGIHAAVVAGIIRFKHQNYYYLNKIINDESSKVRQLFNETFR